MQKNCGRFSRNWASEGHGEFAIAYALRRLADVQAANNRTAKESSGRPAMKVPSSDAGNIR